MGFFADLLPSLPTPDNPRAKADEPMARADFHILVLPGDGIGIEVMQTCLEVLGAVQRRVGGFNLVYEEHPAGAEFYRASGESIAEETMQTAERADAILFGAMGLPDVRRPDGREVAPQLDLRERLELYAGVRPIRAIPCLPTVLADPRAKDIDFVILREQTEGFFFSRGQPDIRDDREAYETCRISRAASERLFDYAFRLAARRKARNPAKGRVTCVDKSNVMTSQAFFNRIFRERAALHPAIAADHAYVDAMALNLVKKPWAYDVLPMENQFGDILSDLAGGLVGSMGLAPSGDIGDRHALFQPAHGTAPDIAGEDKANPTAMFLSAAMMLDWLGDRHGNQAMVDGAVVLERAIDTVFVDGGVRPYEFGGTDGNTAITRAVMAAVAATK